jgi:hypothetical protein
MSRREAYPGWFAPYAELESTCTRLHNWDMRFFTGLLQTEDYAHALIRACHPEWSHARVDADVQARMERQEILKREVPAWFVIGETAFRTVFGSDAVMRSQVDHVAELAVQPEITIQVYPFIVPDCPATDGPVTQFDFDGRPSAGYAEGYEAGRVIESPGEVATLVTLFNHLRAAALSPRDSAAWITRYRSNYEAA